MESDFFEIKEKKVMCPRFDEEVTFMRDELGNVVNACGEYVPRTTKSQAYCEKDKHFSPCVFEACSTWAEIQCILDSFTDPSEEP